MLFWCRQPSATLSHFHESEEASFVFSCPLLALVAFHAYEYKWRLVVLVSTWSTHFIPTVLHCAADRVVPKVQFLSKVVDMPVMLPTSGGRDSAGNWGASAVSVLCHGGRCPFLCRSSTRVSRCWMYAATVPAVAWTAGGPQISSSNCSWSVSEVGSFARFTVIFLSPSSRTSRPRVAGSPGV